jgi:hypothetical protein
MIVLIFSLLTPFGPLSEDLKSAGSAYALRLFDSGFVPALQSKLFGDRWQRKNQAEI